MMNNSNIKSNKNYYQTLGLKTNATQDDIDKAYKKLSTEWHPDKHREDRKQAEQKFHQIGQAYDVLSNRNKRSHYDEINRKDYTDDDAEKTFQKFWEEHGSMMDQNQRRFFDQHYPNRKRNYYQVLGVPRNATLDQIKSAYRKLALQHHPKNHPDNPEARKKFNQINQAYNALSTQAKRSNYDSMFFGEMMPMRAQSLFQNFWNDRWNQVDQLDDLLKPMLRSTWSRDLDRRLTNDWSDSWGNVNTGESYRTSTYYTNRNGVESKKTISTKTRYENGLPISQTTQEYQFPDGHKEIRKIMDDGRGNVRSNVYNLRKGENMPITN